MQAIHTPGTLGQYMEVLDCFGAPFRKFPCIPASGFSAVLAQRIASCGVDVII